MGRLSLVIADDDRDYLIKLVKFLMVNYPQRFDIFSFSSLSKLTDFLGSSEKRDILLINSKIYKKELQLKNIEVVIFLSEDSTEPIPEGFDTLSKYQHAQRLVTDILRLFAARSLKSCTMPGRDNTRVVCVYSPAGGVGKTSIAAGCSILCAKMGLKTFYLNLEDVPSTRQFFYNETEQSFSNVIYHLKGKEKNLGLKLEGARCCDSKKGVYFFAPPDSILEMGELSDHDTVRLVNEFESGSGYDIVFIDMSCGLNQRNIALLGCADMILLVLAPGDTSVVKLNELRTGIDMLEHKYGVELVGRIVTVLNRHDKKASGIGNSDFIGSRPTIEIGEFGQQGANSLSVSLIENVAFLSSLNRLLECVLPRDATADCAYGGGEFIA